MIVREEAMKVMETGAERGLEEIVNEMNHNYLTGVGHFESVPSPDKWEKTRAEVRADCERPICLCGEVMVFLESTHRWECTCGIVLSKRREE